ncbi:eukaryotic translation initiation factor 4B [Drosophila sulfurigaster albostrigata]|uniref:eukaryotic translation initiation factor 4B n=1 Tax=Drosophila sulfurigaster albostrigata TaxID=89887 RepID=UPI002D219413|nr:eukaryotic translation initiation factor 4B [Drosophila sulfurigaster albostrigata]
MASAGKKGKKKIKELLFRYNRSSLMAIPPVGTTQVAKKVRNLDGDESDDGSHAVIYQLPTAPRANRILDDDSIPHKPPFIAYINNLPFDASEDDIYEFFGSINLASLRLPREDGETGRSRGFGYVELENREDLIHVLSLPDPSIKGRRIRIELSNENDQQNRRQQGNRRFEGFGNSSENRDSGNWRRDSQNNGSGFGGGGGGYSGNYDRGGFNRDRKPISERDENNTPGSWRTNSRQPPTDYSPPRRDHRDRDQITDKFRNRNHDYNEAVGAAEERPKLNLKPRTLPLPELVTKPDPDNEQENETELPQKVIGGGSSSVNVFGSAKPVDTATRELEIEERLAEARRLEKFRHDDEDVNELKMSEMQIDIHDNENANASTRSWRRTQDSSTNSEDKQSVVLDDKRRDDRDFKRLNKSRDRNDRFENVKTKNYHDGKSKEDNKYKGDYRNDRLQPKNTTLQAEPVLQSSNKYSGLDDESSD